jgi:purine-cytosine permease-like protein
MAKKSSSKKSEFSLSGTISWIVGILVSLAVGSGMIKNVLTIPYIPNLITQIAGWIVVIGVIIAIIAAIFDKN